MSTSPFIDDDGTLAEVDPSARELDPLIGTTLGAYAIAEKLGEGAMCSVYRAIHTETEVEVAIKVLQDGRSAKRVYAQRLRREAAVSMRIAHENVVKVIECGVLGSVGPYLVMELLTGRTLQDEISRHGPIAPDRAARILRQTAAGLSAAHRAGYIHRDLKPGNLMLMDAPEGERVKILDFGIVGVAAKDAFETQLTEDNLILGTPSHMAPEQFESPMVTPSADLYALGAILYHMLSGHPPFAGTIREIIAQHLVAPPDQLPESGGLGPLAHWLLEKAPDRRPKSAEQVIDLIDQLMPAIGEAEAQAPEPAHLPVIACPRTITWERALAPFRTPIARFLAEVESGLARFAELPLRVAVPIVLATALVIGAFSARKILDSGAEARASTVMELRSPPRHEPPPPAPAIERIEPPITPVAAIPEPTPPPEPVVKKARAPRSIARERSRPKIDAQVMTDQARPAAEAGDRDALELVALRKKLQRVSDAIVDASGLVPAAELTNFEERYFDLSAAAHAGIGHPERESLSARADGLYAQLQTLRHRRHP